MKIKHFINLIIILNIGLITEKLACPIFEQTTGWRILLKQFNSASASAQNALYIEKDQIKAKRYLDEAKKYFNLIWGARYEIEISKPVTNYFSQRGWLGPSAVPFIINRGPEAVNLFDIEYGTQEEYLDDLQLAIDALKTKQIRYKAGGVLPYAKDAKDGKIYFLFSREAWGADAGKFSDFGGKADPGDKNIAEAIAAREFVEESAGLFGAYEKNLIELSSGNPEVFKIDAPYVMYLLKIPYDPLINDKFLAKRAAAKSSHEQEKDQLNWVSKEKLIESLRSKNPTISLSDGSNITIRRDAFRLFLNHLLPILDKIN